MPFAFFTMCRGEAQLLLDLLMIPCFSSPENSFLAAYSLSLSNHLHLAVTGQPSVTRKCCMRREGLVSTLDLLSTLGKSSNAC